SLTQARETPAAVPRRSRTPSATRRQSSDSRSCSAANAIASRTASRLVGAALVARAVSAIRSLLLRPEGRNDPDPRRVVTGGLSAQVTQGEVRSAGGLWLVRTGYPAASPRRPGVAPAIGISPCAGHRSRDFAASLN